MNPHGTGEGTAASTDRRSAPSPRREGKAPRSTNLESSRVDRDARHHPPKSGDGVLPGPRTCGAPRPGCATEISSPANGPARCHPRHHPRRGAGQRASSAHQPSVRGGPVRWRPQESPIRCGVLIDLDAVATSRHARRLPRPRSPIGCPLDSESPARPSAEESYENMPINPRGP